MKKQLGVLVCLVLVAVLTVSTAAMAFSRNLTGSWTTPSGRTFVVVHNTSTGEALFTTPINSPNLPITSSDFKGIVGGANGSTEFRFIGSAEDVAVRTKTGITCTISDRMLFADGQVIGQFPQRNLHMKQCSTAGSVKCTKDDGTVVKEDLIANDCSGTWR